MPYIVPSTSSSSTSNTVTSPHSPSRPPITFSMALASPAPVPAHTPFTPPEIPSSPPLASSSAYNVQSFGVGSRYMDCTHLHPQAPLLVKALSDTPTSTASSPSKALESSSSLNPAQSPPMRRAVSASSASPTSSVYQFTNTAGSSLPRIPRRRGGSAMTLNEVAPVGNSQLLSTPPRGRTRSRFVLGAEEESTSGSDEERRRRYGESDAKVSGKDVEERVSRKRNISADHLMALKSVSSSTPPRQITTPGYAEPEFDHSESGSECATPTQSSILRVGQARERENAFPFKATEQVKRPSNFDVGGPNMHGVVPRARRGRGRGSARKLMFGNDPDEEDSERKEEVSTVSFPSSNPPSPTPAIAVANATPEMSPMSASPKDVSPKSFTGKREKAGSLRLDFSFGCKNGDTTAIHARDRISDEQRFGLSESASLNSVPLIRKKSGEVVRPSLKSRSSSANAARQRPSLSLGDISSIVTSSPSVSAPTTPASAKMVHFDTQLEHVRIFKSTSKPKAVSRSGSPTYDDTTSGGEGDSASEGGSLAPFIPRPRPKRLVPGGTQNEEEEALRRVLMMRVLNMPHRPMEMDDVDVRLETLHLADDASSVQGVVRVRNIAFEKNVAIRFTFDGWQTTSEVLGRWSESCVPRNPAAMGALPRPRSVSTPVSGVKTDEVPAPAYDRFTFSIRLADILLRIDEKTLVLAVRYCSAGREMWDNNDGQNYRAVFERRPQHSLKLAGSAVVPAASPDSGKDKSKGSESGRKESRDGGTSVGSTTSKGGEPISPAKKGSDLSSRYDLDVSLKNPSAWRSTFDQLKTWTAHGWPRDKEHLRTPSIRHSPVKASATTSDDLFNPRSFESYNLNFDARGLPRGSPRDFDREEPDVERFNRARLAVSESVSTLEGGPFTRYPAGSNTLATLPMSWITNGTETHVRNHHRSYFDAWASTAVSSPNFGASRVRRTPPGTPTAVSVHRTLSDTTMEVSPTGQLPRVVMTSAEHPPGSSPGRYHSFPPLFPTGDGNVAAGLGILASRPWSDLPRTVRHDTGESDVSTPSITSGSSTAMTASPLSPPDFSSLTPTTRIGQMAASEGGSMDGAGYNTILSR
ncbi:uncharacterized protein FOMMEDRAFT_26995 [Fomitiporia mediterranea MF3/22]|uniref:uncharacterized protein n=1 Tax=Fomitiporia mediterranea (strain MF3/22) TaxID=694068 RepID=UPI0004407F00|nr:uncharacterized protein FOMMEDRAFT_26995 [Fomitiporia mediterranea MF3/22]EJD06278.1 hypothetical protein FOMMEDRAFT_26995 [Fomitiporia mediterranea MF3/22]